METQDIISENPYYTDRFGVEHQIYPCLFGDYPKVDRMFRKINKEFLILNMPEPKKNRAGNVVIDKKTKEPILDYTKYNIMMELFEMALQESKEEIEKWVDFRNGEEIFDIFLGISGLKKKIQQEMAKAILTHSSEQ